MRDEDLPLITHEEALAVRHWPVRAYRIWRPRTVLQRERWLRAEDSWYVAQDQPLKVDRPDYGGDRPEDSVVARGGVDCAVRRINSNAWSRCARRSSAGKQRCHPEPN